jgi:hypothetical protein
MIRVRNRIQAGVTTQPLVEARQWMEAQALRVPLKRSDRTKGSPRGSVIVRKRRGQCHNDGGDPCFFFRVRQQDLPVINQPALERLTEWPDFYFLPILMDK